MILDRLIRGRSDPESDTGNVATAIPAISATQPRTVARIATVAVANWPEERAELPVTSNEPGAGVAAPAPMTAEEEAAIRAWLAHIEETDADIIAEVLNRCRADPETRSYFLRRAEEVPSKPDGRQLARQKVQGWLGANPGLRLAVVVEEDGDCFVATLGIREKGIVEFAIDRDKYDGMALLSLVERYGGEWPKIGGAS